MNLAMALNVVSGELFGDVLPRCDSENFIAFLESLDKSFSYAHRIELILDNGASHASKRTKAWFADNPRIRPHYTPVRASWLNQAELALNAFASRYTRGAVTGGRSQLVARIEAGFEDYNTHYALPFEWSFTRPALRDWWQRRNCA